MERPYSNKMIQKMQKQKQAQLVHAILNDGIHFVFVQSSYPIFSTKQSHVSFWKASCYFWKVLSENFTDMFVRLIVFNEIPYLSDIAFHIFRHICLLTSGSVNSSKTNGAKLLTSVNQYNLKRLSNIVWKRRLFLKVPISHLSEHRFQPQKRIPFLLFW